MTVLSFVEGGNNKSYNNKFLSRNPKGPFATRIQVLKSFFKKHTPCFVFNITATS